MTATEPDRSGRTGRTALRNRLADPAVPVDVIRVPMALGADVDGVDRGAAELDALLRQRLLARDFPEIRARLGESREIRVDPLDVAVRDTTLHANAMHVEAIAAAGRQLAHAVGAAVDAGHLALVIGGDHALSIGSLAGAGRTGTLGVIWIDAHGDINTPETSPSGHVHGMPLAAAIGRGPRELVEVAAQSRLCMEHVVWIGVRDLDRGERALLRDCAAGVYPMTAVDDLGIVRVTREAIARLRERGVERVHVSFDLDVLDPTAMRGTGTRVPGGLSFREAHQLLRELRASDLPIVSADIVELNPLFDPTGESTAIAAALAATLLGEEML